ncbi:hypothetical protein ACPW7J_03930 [Ihubacter sp. rT4E-8]|uniref:hypothetical protein n=1 Tax=Ihubacter sp. rT4E-8 TaxID=3242369 RepID=UPI003CF5C013
MIKCLGSDEEQGRLFGFFNSVWGGIGLCSTYVILAAVTWLFAERGFRGGLRVYAVVILVAGILSWLIVPYDTERKVDLGDENRVDFRLIGKVLKIPAVWYIVFFTWGCFMVRSIIPYLNPLMTDV